MKPPLISLQNVSVTMDGRKALTDVTWELPASAACAVLGENGAGKTTFLRLARGDVWPDPDGRGERRYHFQGLTRTSPIGFRERFGLVGPELQDNLIRLKPGIDGLTLVLTGFFDSIYLHQPPNPAQVERAHHLISLLRLTDLTDKNIDAMSQGQLRAMLIARALAPERLLLVLDEVFEGLDAAARPLVASAINQAAAAGTAILVSSHHAEEIPDCVDRAVFLEKGRITLQGGRDALLYMPETHPRAQTDDLPAPPVDQISAPNIAESLIRIEQADVFLDRKKILHDVNWTILRGQNWAVLGENGSGKTTLCRLVLGDEHPAFGGRVGRFQSTARIREIKKKIGYVTNTLQAEYAYDVTGFDLVLSGFFASVGIYDAPTDAQRHTAQRWISFFSLEEPARRRIRSLSTGQLRRLLLARTMVNEPALVILDEPFAGLDAPSRQTAKQAVSSLAGRGASLILVTHRPEDVIPEISHILRLENGRIAQSGPLTPVKE